MLHAKETRISSGRLGLWLVCAHTLPYLLCIPDQTNQPWRVNGRATMSASQGMHCYLKYLFTLFWYFYCIYGDQLRRSTTSLCFKGILKCEAIDMKTFFFLFSRKYSITHFEFHKHLGSFWKWEFLELGNNFVSRLSVYLSCARDIYKMWACKRRETWGDFQKKRRPERRQCAFAGYPVSKCQEQAKKIGLKKDSFERSRMSSFSLVS